MEKIRKILFRTVNWIQKSEFIPPSFRYWLLKVAGIKISYGARVEAYVDFTYGKIVLGEHCFINRGCHLEGKGGITLGRKVHLAHRVCVVTSTHLRGDPECRAGAPVFQNVAIGDGCWIGANATVLPGVTIGSGVCVGAGAVVNKSLDANAIYAGVPARLIQPFSP
jgi:maltose O-acetyltransferase